MLELTCVVSVFIFASASVAQDAASRSQPPSFEGQGAFVALVVTDLDASLRWYQLNLGLRLLRRSRSPRVAAETVVLQGHNFFVELIHFDQPRTAKSTESDNQRFPPGLFKAGAIVGARDFESLAKYLQDQKVDFIGGIFEDREMGVRTFLIRDNSGNRIQFFSRMKL
jgi:catechol 2,3-dioxygenase-like lactoylglutathione lyase family enzyme